MRDVYAISSKSACGLGLALLLLAWTTGQAQELRVPLALDTNTSNLGLTLSVLGSSDDDTQRLGGVLILAVDCQTPLAAAAVRDFQFNAAATFQFSLRGGELTAGVTNLQALDAAPGVSQPLVPTLPGAGGPLLSNQVPYTLRGAGAYVASGFTCVALQGFGLACNGAINLADQSTPASGDLIGTLSISNGVMQFSGRFDVPEIAVAVGSTIAGSAVINARGPIAPCLLLQAVDAAHGRFVAKWSSAFPEFRLFRTRDLTPPIVWELSSAPVSKSLDGLSFLGAIEGDGGQSFYRLSHE